MGAAVAVALPLVLYEWISAICELNCYYARVREHFYKNARECACACTLASAVYAFKEAVVGVALPLVLYKCINWCYLRTFVNKCT